MAYSLHDREQAFEAKFAHDEEFHFLLAARRDKLLAHWAAAELGLGEEEESALVRAVLAIPNGRSHDSIMLTHLSDVCARHGHSVTDANLAAALNTALAQAREQLGETFPE